MPVIAAGGIATARGVAAALAAGADGVRVGTRFIAAEESDAHPAWVQAVIAADADDSVVSTAFNVGMPQPGPHRVLRSSIEAAEALETNRPACCGRPAPRSRSPLCSPAPDARSTGAVEAMPFYAGRSAGAVTAVQPAADIVAELARGVPPG